VRRSARPAPCSEGKNTADQSVHPPSTGGPSITDTIRTCLTEGVASEAAEHDYDADPKKFNFSVQLVAEADNGAAGNILLGSTRRTALSTADVDSVVDDVVTIRGTLAEADGTVLRVFPRACGFSVLRRSTGFSPGRVWRSRSSTGTGPGAGHRVERGDHHGRTSRVVRTPPLPCAWLLTGGSRVSPDP